MKRLVAMRKIILWAGIALTGVLLALYWVFSESTEKVTLLVATLIGPVLFYGFIRLDLLIVGKRASDKHMTVASYFCLVAGVIALVMSLWLIITDFPDGYSPILPIGIAITVAVLDDRHRYPPIQP